MSPQLIIKVNDSVANSFRRRKSAEPTDFELQRRTSDVIVTHDEKTQETSLNSMSYLHPNTKVTVFENHNAQHKMDHATLDVPYHICSAYTIK